jgi:hypothetical protein
MGIILLHVLNVNNKGIKQISVLNKMIEMIDLEQEVLETSLIRTMEDKIKEKQFNAHSGIF